MLFCQNLYSSEFKTFNKNKVNEKIKILRSNDIDYLLQKRELNLHIYSVILKDSKKYLNLKIKRVKKVYYKKNLFLYQLITTSKSKALKVVKSLVKQGVKKSDVKVVKKKKVFIQYIVDYDSAKEILEDAQIDESMDSEVLSSFSLARSRLKLESQNGFKESYNGSYIDLLTGVEVDKENYTLKLMGRIESFNENNRIGNLNKTIYNFDEFYYKTDVLSSQITIGRQLFSWGTFDEFSNLDRVNTKNLARFVFDSGEIYRRPISAIRIETYISDFKIDTFYDFGLETGQRFIENSLWAGLNFKDGLIRGGDPTLLNPNLVQNVSKSFAGRMEPGYGIRSSYSGWADVAFTYLRAYPDFPILKISNTLKNQILTNSVNQAGLEDGVTIGFEQEDVFGLDFTKTFWGQLFKFELSYIPDSSVLVESLEIKNIPRSRTSIGGDLELDLFATTITWQYISERLITSENTFLDLELNQFILNTSSSFIQDKLQVGLRYISNLNDNSSYFSPYANYDLSDSDLIGIYYSYFNGEENSFFGFHKEDSILSLNYKKLF